MSLTCLLPQSKVAAQYVLDTPALWRYLGMGEPGLVGSGPYFQAFESIKTSLREMAETVLGSYQARCENLRGFAEVIIDEGDWLSMVAERARMLQPLVLIGKSTLVRAAKEANVTPAEIAKAISCPVVVVSKELISSGCFPVLASDSTGCGTQLSLSLSAIADNLLARTERLSHAA
jgi:predicted LPLAT superfamily acyltransferase